MQQPATGILSSGSGHERELNTAELNRLAQSGRWTGRVIRPVHTLFDGDTLFSAAAGGCEQSCWLKMAAVAMARWVNGVLERYRWADCLVPAYA